MHWVHSSVTSAIGFITMAALLTPSAGFCIIICQIRSAAMKEEHPIIVKRLYLQNKWLTMEYSGMSSRNRDNCQRQPPVLQTSKKHHPLPPYKSWLVCHSRYVNPHHVRYMRKRPGKEAPNKGSYVFNQARNLQVPLTAGDYLSTRSRLPRESTLSARVVASCCVCRQQERPRDWSATTKGGNVCDWVGI